MAASSTASSAASSVAAGLFTNADQLDESCTSRDRPLQAGMTDSKAIAAAATVQAAAATAEVAAAAAAAIKNKHSLTDGAAAVAAATDDGARGGTVVVVGTSNGVLHCISCSSGQQLWRIQTGASISTAAAFCPAVKAHTPSEAPAAAGTDELVDSAICCSAAAHEQTQMHTQTDRRLQQQQQQSSPSRQTGAQPRMTCDHLLVSCNNSGAMRVLSLPDVAFPVASQDAQVLQSGQQAAKHDEEERRNPMPYTYAAAQMPGGRIDSMSKPLSFALACLPLLAP